MTPPRHPHEDQPSRRRDSAVIEAKPHHRAASELLGDKPVPAQEYDIGSSISARSARKSSLSTVGSN